MSKLQHCISVVREDIDAYPSESLARYHYSLLFPIDRRDDEPKEESPDDEYLPLETILAEYFPGLPPWKLFATNGHHGTPSDESE